MTVSACINHYRKRFANNFNYRMSHIKRNCFNTLDLNKKITLFDLFKFKMIDTMLKFDMKKVSTQSMAYFKKKLFANKVDSLFFSFFFLKAELL